MTRSSEWLSKSIYILAASLYMVAVDPAHLAVVSG